MNTATTTITLNEGFLSRRNWLDWLFAVLVTVGGLYAFQRYSAYMDVYEKGILIGAVPAPSCWYRPMAISARAATTSKMVRAPWREQRRCLASSTSCPASRPSCG